MHDIVYVDSAPEYRACACAGTRTNQLVRTRCPQLEDVYKEPEPTATLPAPRGAANSALALPMTMALTAAARQAKQQGNPSCLALTGATAIFPPTAAAVPITADACTRDATARGAAMVEWKLKGRIRENPTDEVYITLLVYLCYHIWIM